MLSFGQQQPPPYRHYIRCVNRNRVQSLVAIRSVDFLCSFTAHCKSKLVLCPVPRTMYTSILFLLDLSNATIRYSFAMEFQCFISLLLLLLLLQLAFSFFSSGFFFFVSFYFAKRIPLNTIASAYGIASAHAACPFQLHKSNKMKFNRKT